MFSPSRIRLFSLLIFGTLILPKVAGHRQADYGGCIVEPASWNASEFPEYHPPRSFQLSHVPESFDARHHWPHCADVISRIGHQGTCKSCWAFVVASTASDRICIASQGRSKPMISPQDVYECSKNKGCLVGGNPLTAWRYYEKRGYVTGSIDSSSTGCKPYLLSCSTTSSLCTSPNLSCVSKCTNGNYELAYNEDRHFGQPGSSNYLTWPTVEQIKLEIISNGPVTSLSDKTVLDGPSNDEGIIVKLGIKWNHAIRIIGWGASTQTGGYWIIANSYGPHWKEGGTARVAFGAAYVGTGVSFGMPKL